MLKVLITFGIMMAITSSFAMGLSLTVALMDTREQLFTWGSNTLLSFNF